MGVSVATGKSSLEKGVFPKYLVVVPLGYFSFYFADNYENMAKILSISPGG